MLESGKEEEKKKQKDRKSAREQRKDCQRVEEGLFFKKKGRQD